MTKSEREKINLKKSIYDYTIMLNRELPHVEHIFNSIATNSNIEEFGGLQELINVIAKYNKLIHML